LDLRALAEPRGHLFDFARLPDGLRSPRLAARTHPMVFARLRLAARNLRSLRAPPTRRLPALRARILTFAQSERDEAVGGSRGRAKTRRGAVLGIKLAQLLALLAIALLCGALPLRRRSAAAAGANRLLEWGNAAAAGIFLGAGFVHMLPEANRTWQQLGWHY